MLTEAVRNTQPSAHQGVKPAPRAKKIVARGRRRRLILPGHCTYPPAKFTRDRINSIRDSVNS